MPVEVISALPAAEPEVDELVGEMVELIRCWTPCLIAQYIGRIHQDLSKSRTRLYRLVGGGRRRSKPGLEAQAWLSTRAPEMPTLRASAGNSLTGYSATTAPFAGFIC